MKIILSMAGLEPAIRSVAAREQVRWTCESDRTPRAKASGRSHGLPAPRAFAAQIGRRTTLALATDRFARLRRSPLTVKPAHGEVGR
jgi:hypothetical protein